MHGTVGDSGNLFARSRMHWGSAASDRRAYRRHTRRMHRFRNALRLIKMALRDLAGIHCLRCLQCGL